MKRFSGFVLLLSLCAAASAAAQVPSALLGTWRVDRILSAPSTACWDADHAKTLLGTTLTYQPSKMIWRGGEVPLEGLLAVSRNLNAPRYAQEYKVGFNDLGIRAPAIREIDLQHEDADITGATTEVPGDTVVLAGPSRIIVSACGVFYEASRLHRP
jgi:hypothetical protein